MTTSSDDGELVRRAAAGCDASVAALAARHQVAVVHYAERMLAAGGGCRADAEDVAQEVFLRALGRLDRYDPRWAFSTWLLAITRRRCLQQLRAGRRRTRREAASSTGTTTAAGADPQAIAAAREESARLWECAARVLPEQQFSALWLRTVEDLPVGEIARVLGRPAATVKVLLFRARRRLAAEFPTRDAVTPAILPLPVVTGPRRVRHG